MKYFDCKCKWCGGADVVRTKEDNIESEEVYIGYECENCGREFIVVYSFRRIEIKELLEKYKV